MSVEYLPFILPFVASLLAIFVSPIVATKLQRKRELQRNSVGHSSMIDNYSGALDSAWNRISILEKDILSLEKESNELIEELKEQNSFLKIRVYDLEREVDMLRFSLKSVSPMELNTRKENGDNT